VELVEERGVVREMAHQERLHGLIVGVRGHQPMARQDPPGVGVHEEDRSARGIERDGVGRLGTDAGDPSELRAELR
jgi:hypothetical protein